MYPVSDTTNRLDIDTDIKFFAYILDVRIDRTIIEIVIISHDIFHEGITFYDSLGILDEIVEYREFCLRHFDLLSREICEIVFVIEGDIAECYHLFFFPIFFSLFCTLRDSSYTCDELTRAKWLCHIVICSKFEKGHFIIF